MEKYSNILIPIDFPEESNIAIRWVVDDAELSTDKITVVHMVNYMPPVYMRPEVPETYVSEDLMEQRAQGYLDKLAKESGLDGCRSIVQFGRPKSRILSIIDELKIDLVVLAKHNRSGVEKLLGSVSNGIANHAACDVLIVH